MKLYHGTNSNDVDAIMNDPRASNAVNGYGFYMTKSLEVARSYGRNVICFDVSIEAMKLVRPVVRLINNKHNGNVMEWVFTQHHATVIAIEADDIYLT